MNSPSAFRQRIFMDFPEEAEALLAALEEAPHIGIRRNPQRACRFPWATEPVPWAENGFRLLEADARPGLHPFHHCGAYYLQEPAAMASAQALIDTFPRAAAPRVLDLCAAPGGKSTQLAAAKPGLLFCNDPQPARTRALLGNLERFGAENTVVLNETPPRLRAVLPEFFSHILVDAPCSGEGMFRHDPGAREQYSMALSEACHERQLAILNDAAAMLAPGGVLVYSTCTFNRLENETTIQRFLSAHPEFIPDISFSLPETAPAGPGCLRIWPHLHMGEGHFVARLLKNGVLSLPPLLPIPAPRVLAAPWQAFSQELLVCQHSSPLLAQNGWLYRPAILADTLGPLHVLRNGLQLAQLRRGGNLVPAHALAMTLSPTDALRSLDLNDREAQLYLHGEELAREAPRGYTLLTFRGLPLGRCRSVDGQLKNLLPHGLRSLSPYVDAFA